LTTKNERIDVHYHIIPKPYVDSLIKRGISGSTFVNFPKWSPTVALKQMDARNVAAAVTSLSTPGVWFGDSDLARHLSRVCNEFQARMVTDYPGRFGSFAFLPLPDVDGALQELEYALDQLGHDGVVLLTDIDGRYLGDPEYEEVFAELNRREAVVFIHPHTDPGLARRYEMFHPLLEWPIHTTRAVIDLLYSGRLSKYPDIRYILPHGGGAIPFIAHRVASGPEADEVLRGATVDGVKERVAGAMSLLRRLYYDTASPGEAHLAALREFVGTGHIVFGTDGGWTPPVQTAIAVKTLTAYDGFNEKQMNAINFDNAAGLFPDLCDTARSCTKRAA
jgi:predicted TIM-barrel fold metal-dependent hydrolase